MNKEQDQKPLEENTPKNSEDKTIEKLQLIQIQMIKKLLKKKKLPPKKR